MLARGALLDPPVEGCLLPEGAPDPKYSFYFMKTPADVTKGKFSPTPFGSTTGIAHSFTTIFFVENPGFERLSGQLGKIVTFLFHKCNVINHQHVISREKINVTEGPSRHSSVGWSFAHGASGLPFNSHQCLHRYVEGISSLAMLAPKRLAGVVREVNLREYVTLLVHLCQVRIRQNPLWLWNPEETSPEVQNRGISWVFHKLYENANCGTFVFTLWK